MKTKATAKNPEARFEAGGDVLDYFSKANAAQIAGQPRDEITLRRFVRFQVGKSAA